MLSLLITRLHEELRMKIESELIRSASMAKNGDLWITVGPEGKTPSVCHITNAELIALKEEADGEL